MSTSGGIARKPPPGSFSSVVSSLVRASLGSSANTVADEDLDKHIADLILKESKQSQKRWDEEGVSAYLSDDEDPYVFVLLILVVPEL
jgi:hypothetical protein